MKLLGVHVDFCSSAFQRGSQEWCAGPPQCMMMSESPRFFLVRLLLN